MVGVPVLLVVWVAACWPFVWVMVVGVGVSWWCCFQCWVAVVSLSRRVPGVCVGVCVLVCGACSGVGWLGFGACVRDWGVCDWGVGVGGLVCVSWFRMLTCLGLFPVFWLLSFVCLVNNAAWGGWCCCWRVWVLGGGVLLGVAWCLCGWAVVVAVGVCGCWVVVWVRVCLC